MTKLYPYIVANGRRLGSQPWFINGEVEKARAAGAADTVVYEKNSPDGRGPTGEWVDISEYTGEVRDILEADVKHSFPDWISEQEMGERSDMKHQAQMADLEPDDGPGV